MALTNFLSLTKDLEKKIDLLIAQKSDIAIRLEASLAREELCDEKTGELEERIAIMQESGLREDPGILGIVKSQKALITQLRESINQVNLLNKHNSMVLNGIAEDLLNLNSHQDILQRRFGIVSGTA